MSFRMKRLRSQFIHEISHIVLRELKDDRLDNTFITILDVETFPDLSQAKVFVSILQGDKVKVVAALNEKSGYIRSLLGKRLHIRKIPKLEFFLDQGVEQTHKIDAILNKIKQEEPPLEDESE